MATRPQLVLDDPFADPRPPMDASSTPGAPLLRLQPPSPASPTPIADAARPETPTGPVVPRWTPDSPSAAHPNLPPPPSYDSPLTRIRTRSNEDPAGQGSFAAAAPSGDAHSVRSWSSDGSDSPSRRAGDRKPGLVRKWAGPSAGLLEAGMLKGGARSSEAAAARRRRNQKLKWGSLAGVLCLVLMLLIGLAVAVAVGIAGPDRS